MCNTFNLKLKKWCWRSFGFVSVLVLGMCYIGSVQADVCFLPSGNCLSDTNLAAPQNYGGEDCSTYIATYRQQHLEYAADCVTCGGREYCKCGSDRRLVGNQCLCQDSDKIIKNGSCTACPSNKEKASETTCQCKSIYNYTPVTNEVCTDSCSESELVGSGATTTAYSNSAQATASSSSATSSYQAAYTGGTNQFAQTSGSHAVLQGTYASMSQSGTSSGSNAYAVSGGNTMQSAAIQLYNKRSCGCKSGYEYVGEQCLEKCDSTKGLTRSGTECVCSDSKKEWSNTENKCVCKTEYDPDGNGGCLTPGCQNPHQVRVNGTCQCDTNSGYYDSIDICQLYLPPTQAYNLNWWDLLQQKATNAVYEVAQCLMPVKAAYAIDYEPYGGVFPKNWETFDEYEEVGSGTQSNAQQVSGGNTGNSQQQVTTTVGAEPTLGGDEIRQDVSLEAMCRKKCAGSSTFQICLAECMGRVLNNDDSQGTIGTTVGIDGEYDGPVDGDSSVPTVSYSCEPDTAGTCWSVQKHCDNSQYLYNDEDDCENYHHSSCIRNTNGCFSPVCNRVLNQYEAEQECGNDWNPWWHCAQSTSTGCYYPHCDYQSDYYEGEQECEDYGTGYTAHCALVPQTVGTGIECYEPICDPALNQYDDEQECETSSHANCDWVQIAHSKSCYVPRGVAHVYCDDQVHDYGQYSIYNLGCQAIYGDIVDANDEPVYTWQSNLEDESAELSRGTYKLVYRNKVRHGEGVYGFTGLVTFNGQRYYCGYTSTSGKLREIKCDRKCLCNNGTVIDCYYDYEITFYHDSEGEEIHFYPFAGDIFHDATGTSFMNESGNWTQGRFSSGSGTCTATYSASWSNN